MENLYALLAKTSRKWALIANAAALAVFGTAIAFFTIQIVSATGYGILDFEMGHSAERITEILGSYGQEGINSYAYIQVLDVVNPALYSLLTASLIFVCLRDSSWSWTVIFPFLTGLLDYSENVAIYQIVRAFPEIDSNVVWAANLLSLTKNVALLASFGALGYGVWTKFRN